MFEYLTKILESHQVDCFAPIPLSACTIKKPYLLEREGIADGTVIMIAVPYYTHACDDPVRNLSAYAVSRNYHSFFDSLFASVLPQLRERYPEHRFAGFADHSPIAEVEAAALAGLGVIGKNHLLLTEKYSSYIFLGELVTDAVIPCNIGSIKSCEDCGACMRKCPAAKIGTCLSALTQKKGDLSQDECETIRRFGSVWGCDICQAVCPHTQKAIKKGTIYSPIPYFHEKNISVLTVEILDGMPREAFQERAFSWRGRDTIRRNLLLFEKGDE